MPGRDWMRGFLSRHKSILSKRWCQNIKRSRSQVNSKVINEYFVELTRSLEGVEPAALVNFDERNMTDDLARRGSKHAYQII